MAGTLVDLVLWAVLQFQRMVIRIDVVVIDRIRRRPPSWCNPPGRQSPENRQTTEIQHEMQWMLHKPYLKKKKKVPWWTDESITGPNAIFQSKTEMKATLKKGQSISYQHKITFLFLNKRQFDISVSVDMRKRFSVLGVFCWHVARKNTITIYK